MTGNTTFQEALPPDLLAAIAARGGRRSWPVNTVLIHEGDSSDSLYIMLAGRVKVFSSGENGREIDCRNEPEDVDQFEDEDGCPDPDNDRDTLLDAVDKCPNDPEDFDQFEDQDGCPDVDNDGDKVLDAAQLNRNPDGTYTWTNNDKKMENGVELDCRNRPEDFDGVEDEDGCPDVLKIDNCQIKLSDKIYFKFNKWDIDPKSFKVLDEVRDTMNNAPDIKIWIDGHTDKIGRAHV